MARMVEVGGLSGMARAFDQIGDALGREAQKGLNEVATSSLKRIGRVIDTKIDGGATPFTRVSEKGPSSVSIMRGRFVGGDMAMSDVHVNPLQSRYLKFLLGEEHTRHAGDTGVADAWNFIPVEDAFPFLDDQGADPIRGQSLRPGSLGRLFRRAEAQRKKVAQIRDKKANHAVQAMEDRKAGRTPKPYKAPKPTGVLKYGRLFFTNVHGTQAIYERTINGRERSMKLLILAQKQSEYRRQDGYLVPGWNRAVEDAMASYPMRMRRRLLEEIDRISTSNR